MGHKSPAGVVVFFNPQRAAARRWVAPVSRWIRACGGRPWPARKARGALAVVAVGGDGTLLSAARWAALRGLPVLGINVGRLGFLTVTDASRARPLLAKLLAGQLVREQRMLLSARVAGGPERHAVNEIMIHGARSGRVVRIKFSVDGAPLGICAGDGLMVATPTGSTAYSMAAGGPLVCPEMDLMLLTPVCPHSLSQRPLVAPATAVVRASLESRGPGERLAVTLDGRVRCVVPAGRAVVVRRATTPLTLLTDGGQTFFDRLRDKLGWG